MGGGASVNIHPPHIADQHFRTLLGDKKARSHLFKEISQFRSKNNDRTHFKDRISLEKMVDYFQDNEKALYPDFHVNVDVLNEAFIFATMKKGKDHKTLTKKDFHVFLPTLFLFVKLWDIFDKADKMVIEDKRVFKGEFIKVKDTLNEVEGVQILGHLTQDEWLDEFNMLDKNKDGHVNFDEFCTYAVTHIKRPFDYAEEFEEYNDDGDGEGGTGDAGTGTGKAADESDGGGAAGGGGESKEQQAPARSSKGGESAIEAQAVATAGDAPVDMADTQPVEAKPAEDAASATTETVGASDTAAEATAVEAEAIPAPVEACTA